MNLESTISVYSGGPGSGCTGPNCGRHSLDMSKVVSSEKGEAHTKKSAGKWTYETHAGQNIDPQRDWVVRHTVYTSPSGEEVVVKQSGGRYLIIDKNGEHDTGGRGSARTAGSAANNYLKSTYGLYHDYRPMHPFHE